MHRQGVAVHERAEFRPLATPNSCEKLLVTRVGKEGRFHTLLNFSDPRIFTHNADRQDILRLLLYSSLLKKGHHLL